MSNPLFLLEQLAQIQQGITLSRYQDEQGSLERIINSRDLEQLHIGSNLSMVNLSASNLSQYRLQAGDVVVAIRGTPLKASVVTDETQNSLAGQNLAVLRPNADINPVYLAVLMRSLWLQQQLNTLYSQSSGTKLLKISQLREIKIPVPNLKTQNQLAQLFLTTERYTRISLEAIETRNRLAHLALSEILG